MVLSLEQEAIKRLQNLKDRRREVLSLAEAAGYSIDQYPSPPPLPMYYPFFYRSKLKFFLEATALQCKLMGQESFYNYGCP
jgi:hypothetical protein